MFAVGGENLIDFVQEEDGRDPPSYIAHPGGSPMNVAMAAARQGMDSHYLTPVSQDSLGSLIAARLKADNVTLATSRRSEPTSLAVVSLKDGAATYEFYRDGTAERQVSLEQLQDAAPEGLSALHIGSLAVTGGDDAPAYEVFHKACFDAGIFTSYDPNVRPSLTPDREGFIARMERITTHSTLLKLSDEDLNWLYPDKSHEDAFNWLADHSGAPVVVLTKGPDGALARAGAVRAQVPAAPVNPLVDTVGAGDTFMATLIRLVSARGGDYSYDEASLTDLLRTASQAAAINCTRAGCQPPTLAELEAALAR
ncbi:MAG: carbohydrate kinase [Rhodobacteraceae bacterium]|nr:carbohydrate kinase [Paracoccaceae bacterium]